MKAVFCANLQNSSASGRQRLWALKKCGVEVFGLDKENYSTILGEWSGRLAKLAKQPRLMNDTKRLGKDLINLCEQIMPDIVWLEWPREFQPEILSRLNQFKPKPFIISFQDDNPWGDRRNDLWMWKDYFKLIPQFDLHLIKRPSDFRNLKILGAKKCIFWEHGVFTPLFFPNTTPTTTTYPVSFIGTCMDDRSVLIGNLLKQNIPIHIFGNSWQNRSDLPSRFPENFHAAVEGEAYAEVIRQSQICIGLVSHSNHDEWTMRTYEVPGCAKMLLAERTATHQKLFIESREAAFFSTAEECTDILRYFISNPAYCQMIGEASYRKCVNNSWTLEGRMQNLLIEIYRYL